MYHYQVFGDHFEDLKAVGFTHCQDDSLYFFDVYIAKASSFVSTR